VCSIHWKRVKRVLIQHRYVVLPPKVTDVVQVTAVVYVNPHWAESDGGQLRVWPPPGSLLLANPHMVATPQRGAGSAANRPNGHLVRTEACDTSIAWRAGTGRPSLHPFSGQSLASIAIIILKRIVETGDFSGLGHTSGNKVCLSFVQGFSSPRGAR
jgi:hypothetical protein